MAKITLCIETSKDNVLKSSEEISVKKTDFKTSKKLMGTIEEFRQEVTRFNKTSQKDEIAFILVFGESDQDGDLVLDIENYIEDMDEAAG